LGGVPGHDDLGIAGLGLEFNVGYWPGGTLPRDRIEFSRQLDRWSLLGLPLAIFLTMPSSAERSSPERISAMTPRAGRDGPSPETQRLRAEQLLPLGLAKHYVQGLFWGQLCDADPGGLAHGGLFDATHRPKPVLDVLASIRQRYLQ
jgi:hypothetical protein